MKRMMAAAAFIAVLMMALACVACSTGSDDAPGYVGTYTYSRSDTDGTISVTLVTTASNTYKFNSVANDGEGNEESQESKGNYSVSGNSITFYGLDKGTDVTATTSDGWKTLTYSGVSLTKQ